MSIGPVSIPPCTLTAATPPAMPLFQASRFNLSGKPVDKPKIRKKKFGKRAEDGAVLSLTRLCLLSLADNMKEVWVKDYLDNYFDQYHFTHIMGPFNMLPSDLVEELTRMLCSRKELSRPVLHLLLVPQLRALSLASCPGLATPALCTLISARCQALCRLDLSGAQQLSAHTQAALVSHLPALRSLSLAGTPCDRRVTLALAHHCPQLRHLDVSCCHFLSPAALLPLAGGILSSSSCPSSSSASRRSVPPSNRASPLPNSSASSSASPLLSPLPLLSLLALDIGFGEDEQDPMATAAYLLLSLPCLEKVALADIAKACHLIRHKWFVPTEEFTRREGALPLEDVWMEWRKRQEKGWGAKGVEDDDNEEDESTAWDGYESDDKESGEESGRDVGMNCFQSEGGRTRKEIEGAEKGRGASLVSKPVDEGLKLHLREVQGLSIECLEAVSKVCPDLRSIALDLKENLHDGASEQRNTGFLLATALETWSGQLKNLSVHYPGPLADLLPALQAVGSTLISLTLEGVKTNHDTTPLIELIRACPRLQDLVIRADPPNRIQEEMSWEENDDHGLPSLPYLTSLTIDFSYEEDQKVPVLSWNSLWRVLKCLLSGSPLLETVSLVAVPCNVNLVFTDCCARFAWLGRRPNCVPDSSNRPLRRLQHLSLARTNIAMGTIMWLVEGYKGIRYLNLSHCWEIKRVEWMNFRRTTNITLVWV